MATQKNASFLSIPVFASASEFRVNTAHFTKEDLIFYIKNMEIIQTLKREKVERKQKREDQIRAARELLEMQFQPPKALTSKGCAPSPTKALIEDLQRMNVLDTATEQQHNIMPTTPRKKLANPNIETPTKRPISLRRSSEEDETYFSDVSTRPDTSLRIKFKKPRMLFEALPPLPPLRPPKQYKQQLKSINNGSDSEESGVFTIKSITPSPTITPSPPPTPPKSPLMRPRSTAIREKPKRSTRARIIALLLRRDMDMQRCDCCPKSTSNLNISKIKPTVFPAEIKRAYGMMRHMKAMVKKPFNQKKSKNVDILDKAMRSMTL